MGRVLAANIVIRDPDGQVRTFAAGQEAPAWVEERVRNPKVWADNAETAGAAHAAPNGQVGDVGGEDIGPPPPKGGPGSGRDAWAAYADGHGFEVPEDAGRDDIVAALDEAGIVTEAPAAGDE